MYLCCFKPSSFGGGLSQQWTNDNQLTIVHLASPGHHSLAMSARLLYFLLGLLVARVKPCIPRDSSWLPSHSSPSRPLTSQWYSPDGLHLCLNLHLGTERPLLALSCADPGCRLFAHLADSCLSAWFLGSSPQCPLSGQIKSSRTFICNTSFLPPDTRSFSVGTVSCCYK